MPAAQANCPTCHGAGDPNGCPDCHGTTPAQPLQQQTRQRQQGQAVTQGRRKWPWVLGALALIGGLVTGGYFLFRNSPSTATTEAMNGKQPAPVSSGSTNLDPAPKAEPTAVAQAPDCPDGSLWDTKKKVCVERSAPPPFPSAITVNIPCPSNCAPAAPPPATSSASVPAPKAPPTATAKVVPVKVDLTLIGNPAAFPPGN